MDTSHDTIKSNQINQITSHASSSGAAAPSPVAASFGASTAASRGSATGEDGADADMLGRFWDARCHRGMAESVW